ncbi:class I SAM-dependent methyltransferase [Pantanalinema rosaneae CENA516]|uniref:class I SAM-dependent methyltransferase n=1 Tax=Pantanalinema rosaneae TaxID=1620701 RepID=UPI003D6DCE8C
MLPNDPDRVWEYYGQQDPYYGVLTWDEYKRENLDAAAIERFFASGQSYIDLVLQTIHQHLDPEFCPTRALDFGCGVGRLVIPLAAICQSAIGVDISTAMLQEAERNCQRFGVSNVELLQSDDQLSQLQGSFDLINSFIVFQHIPCDRGEMILHQMIDRLAANGVGVLHFTYYKQPPPTRKGQWLLWAYQSIPGLFDLRNRLKGLSQAQPMMQMNEYNLNHLFRALYQGGCQHCYVRFTQHEDTQGVILFFQKKVLTVPR